MYGHTGAISMIIFMFYLILPTTVPLYPASNCNRCTRLSRIDKNIYFLILNVRVGFEHIEFFFILSFSIRFLAQTNVSKNINGRV